MSKRILKRLGIGFGALAAFVFAIMELGGPEGATKTLKATITFALMGSGYVGADWITPERFYFVRPLMFLAVLGVLAWALWPQRKPEAPTLAYRVNPQPKAKRQRPAPVEPPSETPSGVLTVTADGALRVVPPPPPHSRPPATPETSAFIYAEVTKLKNYIGPNSQLAPAQRLDAAFTKFHEFADKAETDDEAAFELTMIVGQWLREAARGYLAGEAYSRIKRGLEKRIEWLQHAPGRQSTPDPNDTDELERGSWLLVFNPARAGTAGSKPLSFRPSGLIGHGRNSNEHTWKLQAGVLTISRQNGDLQNTFTLDPFTRRWVCDNAPAARGIQDQTISRLMPVTAGRGA